MPSPKNLHIIIKIADLFATYKLKNYLNIEYLLLIFLQINNQLHIIEHIVIIF